MADTPATSPRQPSNVTEFSVSDLSNAIKRTLEDGFTHVRVRGEISGYRGPHASGHCYFGLKDDKAKIEAVIWRTSFARLKVKPEEGMEVIAQGRITTFPGSSKYQIVVETLEPAGIGALMALLEERKKKLAAEGLFDDARKKPRPFLPRVVGIITSPTGAVIRDMLHGFEERFPTRVVIWPVRVQGDGSASEVAAAIRGFNAIAPGGRVPRPDVIIVARGGGSLEDLWGFNEEIVVRAAAESRIPLISAVGHETDWTLIDLAADARAPTPTKAAEWAVPKHSELSENTAKCALRLGTAMRRYLEAQRAHLKASARGLPSREGLLALPRQRFDACDKRLGLALLSNTRAHTLRHARLTSRLHPRLLETRLARCHDRLDRAARRSGDALARCTSTRRARFERLAGRLTPQPINVRIERLGERLSALDKRAGRALLHAVAQRRRSLNGSAQLLSSLSYRSILNRGYAVVRDAGGAMVRSVAGIAKGDRLDLEFSDGRIATDAVEGGQPSRPQSTPGQPAIPAAASRPARTPRRGGSGSGPGGQGSLF
ncbi:MAG: exodeoxyribonuclease VII large subunit [Hyphomicrobiaceae bacterium]|nr:exodeoxyribonuclease VII large subunit [Hyphomicrobiaceae bacterium]